jgi:uncharacterized membrane protein YidH (DUF202 family)
MLPPSNHLTRERNREAADRTLLAWIRTALTLIAFGFGVSKFAHFMESAFPDVTLDPKKSAIILGVAFIMLGIFGLFAATVQHWQIVRRFKLGDSEYHPPWPVARMVAISLLVIGLLTIIEILLQ